MTVLAERSSFLYRLWDDAGYLLYVGVTSDLLGRFRTHHERQPWAWQVAGHTVEEYPDRPSALAAETVAIRDERPRYNARKSASPYPERWQEPEPPQRLDLLRLDRLALWQRWRSARLLGKPFTPSEVDEQGIAARVALAEQHAAAWVAAGGELGGHTPDVLHINAVTALTDNEYRRPDTHTRQGTR